MPLLDALKPTVAPWVARYRRSPVPIFLAWWRAELVGLLPPRWQGWFQDRRVAWLVGFEDGSLALRRSGEAEPFARLPLDGDRDVLRADVQRLLGREPDPDRRLLLAVPASQALLRHLQFPAAVEANLRQVLAFEMDRQSPFKADQVYYDQQVEPAAAGRQIRVRLAIVPRPVLDGLVERARALDLPLDGADLLEGPGGAPAGFNLLPEALRARRSDPQRRINWILAAAAVLLAVLAMQQSLVNRAQALDGLRANVEEARTEARAVTALRNQLDNAVEGAGYLTERKRQTPSVLRVLADVSARLPDHTWLERMSFREGALEIAGQSDEATRLIALLQDSRTLANPAFIGQISPDARTRKERFTLTARYRLQPGADDPVPAPEQAPDKPDDEPAAVAPAEADQEAADADAPAAG